MPPKQSNEHIGYNSLYLERSGEQTLALVDKLLAKSEFPLSDKDHDEALCFEAGLMATHLGRFGTIESILRLKTDENQIAPLFFGEAFVQGEVQSSNGQTTIPQSSTQREAYTWLAMAANNPEFESTLLINFAGQSEEYYKKSVVRSLETDSAILAKDIDVMPIVLNSQVLADSIQSYDELRNYLLELRTIYKEGGIRLDGAKRAIVDVYLAKTNAVITGNIICADYLLDQLRLLDNSLAAAMAITLIPDTLRNAIQNPETKARLYQRFDYLRNGMGTREGKSSPFSDKLLLGIENDVVKKDGIFTDEEQQILCTTMIDPLVIQTIFTEILSQAEILSSEDPTTWSPKRTIRAKDQLYQVVINPLLKSFGNDGQSGVFKVPSEPRSLYDVMVIGGSHELEHLDQSEADMLVSQTIQLAALKGKRVAGIREAGANMTQRAAEQSWFGESKPFSLTYVKALEALEGGNGLGVAARAFFNAKRTNSKNNSIRADAREAADRVLRLIRKGGISSQPLVYVEESILVHELKGQSADKQKRATAVTSFDLVDQVRLHEYGLLPEIPQGINHDWSTIVLRVMQPYINQALGR